MVALVGGVLYLVTTAAVFRSGRLEVPAVATEAPHSTDGQPSWNFSNPELEQWVEEFVKLQRVNRELLGGGSKAEPKELSRPKRARKA